MVRKYQSPISYVNESGKVKIHILDFLSSKLEGFLTSITLFIYIYLFIYLFKDSPKDIPIEGVSVR